MLFIPSGLFVSKVLLLREKTEAELNGRSHINYVCVIFLLRRAVKCPCSFICTCLPAITSGCCVRGFTCTLSSWWQCSQRSSTSCGIISWAGVSQHNELCHWYALTLLGERVCFLLGYVVVSLLFRFDRTQK